MITYANRASAVLYGFLKSHAFNEPFLIPANVCPVVPLTMMKAGVDFEFIDIDERHTMSEALAIERLSKRKYAGLLFVHSYGKKFDNDDFYSELKRRESDLCIIDDRCLCKPEMDDILHKNVDLVLYSTGYAKYIELSYGGYGIIRDGLNDRSGGGTFEYSEDKETEQQVYIKDCLRCNRKYELPADYPWLDGSPLKMDPDQYFGIIKAKMATVECEKEKINRIYRENLPQEVQWGDEYSQWRFMISVENRDEVLNAIFGAGLFAGTNFPPISWMFKSVHCETAEKEAKHIINLFNDFRVNEQFAHKVCEIINSKI